MLQHSILKRKLPARTNACSKINTLQWWWLQNPASPVANRETLNMTAYWSATKHRSRDAGKEHTLRTCSVFCLFAERLLLVKSERLSVGLFVYVTQLCGFRNGCSARQRWRESGSRWAVQVTKKSHQKKKKKRRWGQRSTGGNWSRATKLKQCVSFGTTGGYQPPLDEHSLADLIDPEGVIW